MIQSIAGLFRRKSIYQSDQWKCLDVSVRYFLVPTFEGVRDNAIVTVLRTSRKNDEFGLSGADFCDRTKGLEYCISRMGLRYLAVDAQSGRKYCIASEKGPLADLQAGRVDEGNFLAYPGCCIEEYSRHVGRQRKDVPCGPGESYWSEALEALAAGTYDTALDYTMHIPCSAACAPSIELAGKVRDALIEKDPQAAQYLARTNRGAIEDARLMQERAEALRRAPIGQEFFVKRY